MTTPFADRLDAAIAAIGSPACVGLDPSPERLPREFAGLPPPDAAERFCLGVIEACAGVVPAVKPQSACFERFGSDGVRALERVCAAAASAGLVVILDAKRGDIGLSTEHYAAAAARLGAHAITVNGYLGVPAVEPFLRAGLGVFVLARTSNPEGDSIQSARLADGRRIAELVADEIAALGTRWMGRCGRSSVGAVVGATKASEARSLRGRMPDQPFLIPGYGAQGGTADDVRALLDSRAGGVIVNASRSVIFAFEPGASGWTASIRAAASSFAAELRDAVSPPIAERP